MSLISGSYSRACGGGGAPDCKGAIVENFVVTGRIEDPKFALLTAMEGARRSGAVRRVGERKVLVAVRTLRLIVDIALFSNLRPCRCQIGRAHSIGKVLGSH
jgi:hypothetical protein